MANEAKGDHRTDNVVSLPLTSCGDFTPRERAKLREMMEAFDKITLGCPIARRIAHPDD